MSKSDSFILTFPLVLLLLIIQVYGLWGWFEREGWIQYFSFAEVYALFIITLFYLRSIIKLNNAWANTFFVLLTPVFYVLFRSIESGVGSMVNSLWYINIIISIMTSTWLIVFLFGMFYCAKALSQIKVKKQTLISLLLLILMSVVLTYLIKNVQLTEGTLLKLWSVDKLRTIWFLFEPFIVLCFSLMSLYFYLNKLGKTRVKKEYVLIGLLGISLIFEYLINGVSLVSLRTIIYFLGIYSFIRFLEDKDSSNYLLIFMFIVLVGTHLVYYSGSPTFFTAKGMIAFLHNAFIESIKMFLSLCIFILIWKHVKDHKKEFRAIMILVSMVAYTYTTQSQGNGIHFYDIVAITAMLKIISVFLIVQYGFYYFRKPKVKEIQDKE